jgi:hypothetical protein
LPKICSYQPYHDLFLCQKNHELIVSTSIKYISAISVVTCILNAIVVLAHFHPVGTAIFVGTKVEGVVIFVLVVCWSAIVAGDIDAADFIGAAEDTGAAIQSANLYYFSWAGFITSIILCVSFLRDSFGLDVVGALRHNTERLQWWAALLAATVVVLGSAAHANRTDCGNDSEAGETASYCRKTRFAISAATIGMVLCLLIIYTKIFKYTSSEPSAGFLLEAGSSFFLVVMNLFVVFFTTSVGGPGRTVGNLYYFSWAVFLLSAFLASQCYNEFAHPSSSSHESGGNGTSTNGNRGEMELQVETFDDNI